MNYKIERVLANYNFYENGQLKFILSRRQNAMLIKEILESDMKNENFAIDGKEFYKEIIVESKEFKLREKFEFVKDIVFLTVFVASALIMLYLLLSHAFPLVINFYKSDFEGFLFVICFILVVISVVYFWFKEQY